jgi:hypothetical protein
MIEVHKQNCRCGRCRWLTFRAWINHRFRTCKFKGVYVRRKLSKAP